MVFNWHSPSTSGTDSDTESVAKTGSCPSFPRTVLSGPFSQASTDSDTRNGGTGGKAEKRQWKLGLNSDLLRRKAMRGLPASPGLGVGIIRYLGLEKRKLIRLKEQYFKQNGGLLLQQQLHEHDRTTNAVKIFNVEELEVATNHYDDSRIVGRGVCGTVYKGILPNSTMVVIKKFGLVDENQIEQFISKVIVLSQINHRNVVKLLGCCLETKVPLLVYEFVNNGTLFEHIHNLNKSSKMSWETRLRIASETAGVLSYLHYTASIPIIHQDVKSMNILLDANYTVKVSDVEASGLVLLDHAGVFTMVQGTLGYLDPEYLLTGQLTEKSDVYSFGVVLVELLTGKKALSFDRPEEERTLAMYFLLVLKDRLFQIVEELIAHEDNEQVKRVADLAKRCLKLKGEERPTMKEVASELDGIRAMANHPWVNIDLNSKRQFICSER